MWSQSGTLENATTTNNEIWTIKHQLESKHFFGKELRDGNKKALKDRH